MTPAVVLTGFMGSGKSTVGQELSRLLDVEFIDTDTELERREGRTIADIFTNDGEAAFRALEVDTVLDVLATHDGVIALGGGSITNPKIVDALSGHHVVYLKITAEQGFSRVAGSDRPLLASADPGARYAELLAGRLAVYSGIATQTVDASALPADVAAMIISGLPQAS
ncbi:shikimate kinase [Gordonia sp. TBRC 11910]|uniref:Shikimate kinase n=1 Tax=Gordonia asplenii TaxID=2725283 RepID=A0A848L320_9ACTN|nr:shikimate kinase [Gordonia asplenii]NMO03003.1 shikimate kinase [Gordonia asplenii]